jgi:hypothetical protein
MPFSIIAVLLLVLSSTSIALFYGLDAQKGSARIPQERLKDLTTAMDAAAQDVARAAYSAAVDAVRKADRLDQTEMRGLFASYFGSALLRSFPSRSGDITVTVSPAIELNILMASLRESSGSEDDASGSSRASVPAYLIMSGNYSLNVSCPDGALTRTIEMDQEVYVPVPLLLYKLERLEDSASPKGKIESMVRYELATLAQDRVLRGYGTEAKSGAYSTEAVIITEDVVRAVNLAVVLEEMSFFQDIGAVDKGLEGILPSISGLDGQVDPADLFLRSYGNDPIDLADLVGQALYARADAIVLKWLDYLGLIDLVDLGEDIVEFGKGSLFDTLDHLTGGYHGQSVVTDYISAALAEAGIQEYDYRWYCYGGGDIVVELPSYRMAFNDDNGSPVYKTFRGTYVLDLPSLDLFSSPAWGVLYDRFRSETHSVAESMRAYIKSIASGITAHCSLGSAALVLDPEDGVSYTDELDRQLSLALQDGASWLTPALDRVSEMNHVRDGLAQSLLDFIDSNWMDILEVNRSVHQGARDLTEVLLRQLENTPNFSADRMNVARDLIFIALLGDHWGAREEMYREVGVRAADVLNRLESGLSQKYIQLDPMIPKLVLGTTGLPGVGLLMSLAARESLDGFRSGLKAQGGIEELTVHYGGSVLTLADGMERMETFNLDSEAMVLSDEGTTGSIAVEVTCPWQFDRQNTSYPNRHVTDLEAMTSTPFETQWGISYQGSIALTIGLGGDRLDFPCMALLVLQGSFNLVTFTGWSLEGVDYQPTATIMGDIKEIILSFYVFLLSAVETIGSLAGDLFVTFTQFMDAMMTCSTGALGEMDSILSAATGDLEGIAKGSMGTVLGALADHSGKVMGGTTVDLTLLGLDVTIAFAPPDSALFGTEDRLRIDISNSAGGAHMSSSLRILQLSTGDHVLAASMGIGAGDWSVDLVLDPLMMVYPHQVEVRGYLGGHVIEMFAPEIERTQKVALSLREIPGLGQLVGSIPSPVPGTKWHIDAGLEFSFKVLDRQAPLINEIELNPPGGDRSKEWVEIYNPGNASVDLTGWSLATSRGQVSREVLHGVIPAHGYIVHQFTGQALDNGDVEGFPVQESVVLLDPHGKRVDSAPWLKDLADDRRTWQRSYDGSSRWEHRNDSRAASNGFVLTAELDLGVVAALMVQCFEDSFRDTLTIDPDLGTVQEIIVNALRNLNERMLDSLERSVSSLRLFIKLGLDDLSGTIGGGVIASLVYDGRAVRDCIEWCTKAIGEVIRDPLNPLAAATRVLVPMDTLADHVYVQLGVYLKVGSPDLLEGLVGTKLSVQAQIKASLGTLGVVDTGAKEVHFGVVASGIQGVNVKTKMGQSASACYDVWLIRGSLRPV